MKNITVYINEGLQNVGELFKSLLKKYDANEISAEVIIQTLRAEIEKEETDDEVKLLKGEWIDGTVQYKGNKYKIKYIDDKYGWGTHSLHWIGVNPPGSKDNGFFINQSQEDFSDPTLKFVWVDKNGKLHDTKDDWEEAKKKMSYSSGPCWSDVNMALSFAEFIKRWVKLQEI